MSKTGIYILIAAILIAIIAVIYFGTVYVNSKAFKKKVLKKDNEFKYFLYEEFDTPAVFPEDNEKVLYQNSAIHGNNKYYVKGSGKRHMNKGFILLLDDIRKNLGRAIVIYSGYRSELYNERLTGAVPYSAHTFGLAADIPISNWTQNEKDTFLALCRAKGIKRIGHYGTYYHIDTDENKPQVEWNG